MATPVVLKALLDLSDGVTFNETSADCYDISDIVITANTRRGRSRELDKIEAGYAVITVIDENGDFNPDNDASPYYGKLKPGNKIRLYPDYNDGTGSFRYPDIFTGYVFNYGTRFSMGVNQANQITIEAYDAFKIFNSVSITEVTNSTTGDSSDERIDQILDEINWPAGLRLFETSALSLADDQGNLRTVLDAIRQVEDTEVGLVFVNGSGIVEFKNRTTANSQPDYNSAYKFSDDGLETSYNDLRLTQNDDVLINRVTVKSFNNSTEVTVFDSTSETTYFSRSAERGNVLLTSTTDLTSVANQLLANYKDSSLQIERIILNLSEYEQIDRVIAGLYFDIFEIPIWIKKTLPGNTSITRLGYLQGVNHDITPNSWLVTGFTGVTSFFDPYIPNWLITLYNGTAASTSVDYFVIDGTNLEIPAANIVINSDETINALLVRDTPTTIAQNALIKLNKNGAVLEKVLITSEDDLTTLLNESDVNIANAPNNAIYFNANKRTGDNRYTLLSKINSDYTVAWTRSVLNATTPNRLVSDGNNAYIMFLNTTGNIVVAKYNENGTSEIATEYYSGTDSYYPYCIDAVYADNHIYALIELDYAIYEILKINSSTELVDQIAVYFDELEFQDLDSFSVDNDGNKYLMARSYTESAARNNLEIIKINASNAIEYSKYYTDTVTNRGSQPQVIKINASNEAIALITVSDSSNSQSYFVIVKLDSNGTILEQYKVSNIAEATRATGLEIDSNGRLIAAVGYQNTNSGFYTFSGAGVINLKPSFETLGTYTYIGTNDLVYGTYDYTFATDSIITFVSTYMNATSYTVVETTRTLTLTNVTSDESFLEFD